ncbi:hypothetical protein [Agromyces neolithicus]
MTERTQTPTAAPPGTTESQDAPVFVDPSGRRRHRVRLISGLALGAIAVYLGLVATAFLGGPAVVTPLLPKPTAAANDAARQVPASVPAPSAVPSVGPAEPALPAPIAPETAAPQPTPLPVAPAPTEPARDEPGKSETAPGQANAPEHPKRP